MANVATAGHHAQQQRHHGGGGGPGTQLGGHAFNHSTDNETEAEYDRLRGLARQEASKRAQCFDRAHDAYTRGDGASASTLSAEGKQHGAQMEKYNQSASEYIFRANNAPDRVAADTIDLHGQFVDEAERIVEQRLRQARATNQSHLHVIVGKGNHSRDHVQKIKPAVERLCDEMGLRYRTEENAGRIYVDLTGNAPPAHPGEPAAPGYAGAPVGGYPQQHGGQHGGHQQQHQQHQQQGGNNNAKIEAEVEKLARRFLPRILRKLRNMLCRAI